MNALPVDKKALEKVVPYTFISGILLIVPGTAGILLPGVMSLYTEIFVTGLLLTGGLMPFIGWKLHKENSS